MNISKIMDQSSQGKTEVPVYQVVWSDESTAKVIPVPEVRTTKRASRLCGSRQSSKLSAEKPIEVVNTSQENVHQLKPIEHEVREQILPCDKSVYSKRKAIKMEPDDTQSYSSRNRNSPRKRFINSWFTMPAFSNWLQESPIPGFAYCRVCNKDLQPGKSELQKHSATAKHSRKMAALGYGSNSEPIRQHFIDLRCDSNTKPSRLMLEAMNNIEIRDISHDVDLSVNELEIKSCMLLEKDAALFVPSGQMANLIALRTHCWNLSSTVIVGDKCTMNSGSTGILDLLGIGCKTVRNLSDGTLDLVELATVLEQCSANGPTTSLICIENSHERMGGQPISNKWMKEMNDICTRYGAIVHLDGARLINASLALSETLGTICENCATVVFELDRCIGAPGGCVLAGPVEFINRAKLIHKSYGGVIRSAGVLAAACLVALNNNIKRIPNDHCNAIALAKGVCLANSSAVTVDVESTLTNIVLVKCDNIRITPKRFCERLMNVTPEEALEFKESIFIRAEPSPPDKVKLILYCDITADDVRSAVRKLQYVIREIDQTPVVELFSEVYQL